MYTCMYNPKRDFKKLTEINIAKNKTKKQSGHKCKILEYKPVWSVIFEQKAYYDYPINLYLSFQI
jgi:hypothetical protein